MVGTPKGGGPLEPFSLEPCIAHACTVVDFTSFALQQDDL